MLRLLLGLVALLFVLYLFAGLKFEAPGKRGRVDPSPRAKMTRSDALLVLGLDESASKREILSRYRELVRKVHPDTPGGSTYLTAQLNQAREVLLG